MQYLPWLHNRHTIYDRRYNIITVTSHIDIFGRYYFWPPYFFSNCVWLSRPLKRKLIKDFYFKKCSGSGSGSAVLPEVVIYCEVNEKDQFTMSTAHKIGGGSGVWPDTYWKQQQYETAKWQHARIHLQPLSEVKRFICTGLVYDEFACCQLLHH